MISKGFCSLIIATALVPAAFAGNIISSNGSANSPVVLGGIDEATWYVSWTMASAYSNVSVAAEVGNDDNPDAAFSAYLTTAIGPGETAGDVVASATISPGSDNELIDLFSGLNLEAGTYNLVLAGSDTSSDISTWWATALPTSATLADGVTFNGEGYAYTPQTNVANPPASIFYSYDVGLLFQVDGDPGSAAPEPSSLGMMLTAALAASWIWRRRRSVVR